MFKEKGVFCCAASHSQHRVICESMKNIALIAKLHHWLQSCPRLWHSFPLVQKKNSQYPANKPVVDTCLCSMEWMFIKTRARQLAIGDKPTLLWPRRGSSQEGRRKMTLTCDKDAFPQSHSVLVAQRLFERAATRRLSSVQQSHKTLVMNVCFCLNELTFFSHHFPPSSFQSVITGAPSCAFPLLTLRKSSAMIRPRTTGSWPCAVLAWSTWRALQWRRAKWSNWLRGLAICGWRSTGKTAWCSPTVTASTLSTATV